MNRVKLILLVIAVPLLALVTARWIEGDFEQEWRTAWVDAIGAEEAQNVPAITEFCQNPEWVQELDMADWCGDVRAMTWMNRGAIGTLAAGLALLSLIALAGQVARRKRTLLVAFFGPGMHLTVIILFVLILLHGALGVATIWYGESALVGQVHVQIMLAIGLAAVLGAFSMGKAVLSMVRRVTSHILGRPLSRADHPEIWRNVDNLAARMGIEPPQHIIAGLFPTFFVTEADVETPDCKLTGRTLYLSLPLCRVMTRGELESVIGHELGHFRGQDTAFSRRFYPIYRGAETALQALAGGLQGYRSLPLMPAVYTLVYFLESFAKAESEVSRAREFIADQAGAEVAGARNMASALVKVHAFADEWEHVHVALCQGLARHERMANASLHFADTVREHASPQVLEGLDEQQVAHPTDSHPPLSQRLEALSLSLDAVSAEALKTDSEDLAIRLFPDAEWLEAQLTEDQNQFLVATNQVLPGSALA